MKFSQKFFLSICCLVFPAIASAWFSLGHMVVADIAYRYLDSNAQKKVDKLVNSFGMMYPDMASFMQMAYWPDTLRTQKIEMFTHWHYIDIPFSLDDSEIKKNLDTDNARWAINNIEASFKYKRANPYELARFLAFLIHIVGDIHQPLHTVSNFSSVFPNGDQGGNLYFIRYNNEKMNLHRLWDSGFSLFDQAAIPENAEMLADAIIKHYPRSYFGSKTNDLDVNHWLQEGMLNAKSYVYTTPIDHTPSDDYLAVGEKTVESQVALAGYRLATLLNILLQ